MKAFGSRILDERLGDILTRLYVGIRAGCILCNIQLTGTVFRPCYSLLIVVFVFIGCDKKSYRIDCSDTDYQLIAV